MSNQPKTNCDHMIRCDEWGRAVEAVVDGTADSADARLAAEAAEHCLECREKLKVCGGFRIPGPVEWTESDLPDDAALLQLTTSLLNELSLPLHDESGRYLLPNGQPFPTSDTPGVIGRLGRYDVLGWIGQGAMGTTYRGWDKKLDRIVSLKIMKHDLIDNAHDFLKEAKAQAAIDHPGAVTVYDADFDEAVGCAYIVSAFVDGQTLSSMLETEQRIAIDQALSWADQLLSTLSELHPLGVVHRDIKPSNMMIDRSGCVRLLDFGIARCFGEASLMARSMSGTPSYMSPEQVHGHDGIDPRTDLYAVGVCLFEMITGALPYMASNTQALLELIRSGSPSKPREVLPALPIEIDRLIQKSIARSRAERFQSADAFRAMIAQVRRAKPGNTRTEAASTSEPAIDAKIAQTRWSIFLGTVEANLRRQTKWYDPIREKAFKVRALPTPVQIDLGGGIRHAATRLLARYRYDMRRRRLTKQCLHVRIEVIAVVRLDRLMREGNDREPIDLTTIQTRLRPVLDDARHDHVWPLILALAPTGLTEQALHWARSDALGDTAGLVVWTSAGGTPYFNPEDPVLTRLRDLLNKSPDRPSYAEVHSWVMETLSHRPALSPADLAEQFEVSLVRAHGMLDQLAEESEINCENIAGIGKVLRLRH